MGSITGGKGETKQQAPAQPTVINNSNPAMDAYLANQAASQQQQRMASEQQAVQQANRQAEMEQEAAAQASQQAMQQQQMQQQQMNSQLMQSPQMTAGDSNMKPAQRVEQGIADPNVRLSAIIRQLRGG